MLAGAALLSHALEGEKQESKEEKERYKKAAPLDKLLLPSAVSFAPYLCGISIISVSGDHNSHKFNRLLRAGSVKTAPILVEVCSTCS